MRINGSILITAIAVVLAWLFLDRSFVGFQMSVGGAAPAAARYAGFKQSRSIWIGLLVSGATAGLAGMMEAAGPLGQLTPVLSPGYGFTAIIVAFVGRLTPLGVVHTHPGSLRHPSDGDLRGDAKWVRHLRGQEGVFGIGTADATLEMPALFAYQPRPHVQCLGELRFTWYALGDGDSSYRPLPVELTIGPDLARGLHLVWEILEAHAERLERLYRQQTGTRFEVVTDGVEGPGLMLTLPLAGNGDAVRVVLRPKSVRYFVEREGELLQVDHQDDYMDRGVYLLLAELSARA